MKRRGITVVVGFVFVVVFTILVGVAPVPYLQFEPGPTFNTLGNDDSGKPVIEITGASVSKPSAGQLRFVTIGALDHLTLLQALVGWVRHDDAVIPRELVYGDQTEQQVNAQNAADFKNSQSDAAIAAEIKLGYPLKVTVTAVAKGLPADGKLQVKDVIVAVDGTKIDSADQLLSIIRAKPAGSSFDFEVNRAGVSQDIKLTSVDDQGTPRIGFTPDATSTAPFTITVPIENIGGPSAGLMLTLGMLDKLEPDDLTGGKIIAGTGTIDALGQVGPIGGIPQKLIAAKAAGAQYFLTPKDNCAEAVANKIDGMPLVQVSSLDTALAALEDIRSNKPLPLCPGD